MITINYDVEVYHCFMVDIVKHLSIEIKRNKQHIKSSIS